MSGKTADTQTQTGSESNGSYRKNKRERWLELGPKRTEGVINACRLLGNCANRSQYEWTETELETVRGAVIEAVNNTLRKFESAAPRDERPAFHF